jgi:hypothetical protein
VALFVCAFVCPSVQAQVQQGKAMYAEYYLDILGDKPMLSLPTHDQKRHVRRRCGEFEHGRSSSCSCSWDIVATSDAGGNSQGSPLLNQEWVSLHAIPLSASASQAGGSLALGLCKLPRFDKA